MGEGKLNDFIVRKLEVLIYRTSSYSHSLLLNLIFLPTLLL